MPAALAARQNILPPGRRFLFDLHTLQPDARQSPAYNPRIEILHFFPPIKFLDPRVIYHHPEKAAGRQQWIDLSEASSSNSLPDKPRQHLEIIGNIVAKE